MIRQLGRAPISSDGPGIFEFNDFLYVQTPAGLCSSLFVSGVSDMVKTMRIDAGIGVDPAMIERIIVNYNDTLLKAIAITKKPDVINGMAMSRALG